MCLNDLAQAHVVAQEGGVLSQQEAVLMQDQMREQTSMAEQQIRELQVGVGIVQGELHGFICRRPVSAMHLGTAVPLMSQNPNGHA